MPQPLPGLTATHACMPDAPTTDELVKAIADAERRLTSTARDERDITVVKRLRGLLRRADPDGLGRRFTGV
ncbi:MAG: hypothetical protein REI94_10270 [Moraxellaceae bacterium]|nr:hypothetical protein [Moraxellaceae bacterium]